MATLSPLPPLQSSIHALCRAQNCFGHLSLHRFNQLLPASIHHSTYQLSPAPSPLSPARSNQITAGASPPQASSPRRRRQAQPWISINHAVTQAALRRARAPLLSLSKKPRLQRRLLAVVSPLSSCCHHPQLVKAAAAPTSTPASAPSSISMLKRKKPEEI